MTWTSEQGAILEAASSWLEKLGEPGASHPTEALLWGNRDTPFLASEQCHFMSLDYQRPKKYIPLPKATEIPGEIVMYTTEAIPAWTDQVH